MIGTYGMGEQTPREVEDADRVLGALFGGDDPDAGAEARLWQRVQSELGPQARPWQQRFAGFLGTGSLAMPGRRVALVGGLAAVMVAAVLIVPSLGGSSASAAILEAVDDLSAATSAALSDDDLTEAELADLREQADGLLTRIQNDPSALGRLDLTDLSAAITSLQAVEALLVDQQAGASAVVSQVGQAAQQVEAALQTRDPNNPLLAATVTGDAPATAVDLAAGRREFHVADAGSVILEVRDGSLFLVAARPAAGWIAVPRLTSGPEIEVRFELGDGREVEFEAELEDGLLSTKIDESGSGGGSSGSGSSGSGGSSGGSGTSTPNATSTPGATGTPSATATPGATSTPSATGTPEASTTVRGSIAVGTTAQSISVGAGGTVVIDASSGLVLVSATPAAGWVVVRQDVDSDRVEVRFGQGTTQWRFDARLDGEQIDYEVSQHLNEDPAGTSSDDNG